MYRIERDGKPIGFQGTYNECWKHLHDISYGASVDWLIAHEGYAIVPFSEGEMKQYNQEQHQQCWRLFYGR